MAIGEKVKLIRFELKLEQKEFGALIGVSESSVSQYEKGQRVPRIKVIKRMLELAGKHKLKISPGDFLE